MRALPLVVLDTDILYSPEVKILYKKNVRHPYVARRMWLRVAVCYPPGGDGFILTARYQSSPLKEERLKWRGKRPRQP